MMQRTSIHGRCRAEPRELLAMRTTLRGWLTGLGIDGDAEHTLVTAANEAATNAVEHAYRSPLTSVDGQTFEVALEAQPGLLCLEISDRGMWRGPSVVAEGRGLGIPLMHQLVGSVTIDTDDGGTRVVLRHRLAR
jgi:anti-sigma regulatory factor (Ser/Thr protein kinase)